MTMLVSMGIPRRETAAPCARRLVYLRVSRSQGIRITSRSLVRFLRQVREFAGPVLRQNRRGSAPEARPPCLAAHRPPGPGLRDRRERARGRQPKEGVLRPESRPSHAGLQLLSCDDHAVPGALRRGVSRATSWLARTWTHRASTAECHMGCGATESWRVHHKYGLEKPMAGPSD